MSLPNLSSMVRVGELRYIQSLCEAPEYRNPDAVVGAFLSLQRRLACVVRGKLLRSQLRAQPFYHYLLARTKYYDEVFLDAVYDSARCIVNVGCGTDTRAYRFEHLLRQKGVAVLECDQPQAIRAKQKIAQRRWPTGHIRYVKLDLCEPGRSDLAQHLEEASKWPALVIMEGVSPYISTPSFEKFLRFLAGRLHPSSLLAYDFKIIGTDQFSRSPKVPQLFRLPGDRKQVAAYHAALGFQLQHMELSSELCRRLLPGAALSFDWDCLLRLSPCGRV